MESSQPLRTPLTGLFDDSLLPLGAGAPIEEQEKVLYQNSMLTANALAMPLRAAHTIYKKFCEDTIIGNYLCPTAEIGAKLTKEGGILKALHSGNHEGTIKKVLVGEVKSQYEKVFEKAMREYPDLIAAKYGIPQEETIFFLQSIDYVVQSLSYVGMRGKLPTIGSTIRAVSHEPLFSDKLTEVAGKTTRILQNDSVVFRFHNSQVNPQKAWKIWPRSEESLIETIDQVKQRLAKLPMLSAKPKVTIARIPARTPVQIVKRNSPFVSEEAIETKFQYQFSQFSPNWVKNTRNYVNLTPQIPQIPQTPSSQQVSFKLPKEIDFETRIDLKEAAEHIMDLAGDVIGVTAAAKDVKDLKNFIAIIIENPQQGPLKIVEKLIDKPAAIFENALNAPKNLVNSGQAFFVNPSVMTAFGVVTGVLAVSSVVNELLPFLNIAKKALRNPEKAPVVITKELIHLQMNNVKTVMILGKSLIKDPLKTGEKLAKTIIKSPVHSVKSAVRGVKSFFGHKKKKKKKKVITPVPSQVVQKEYMNKTVIKPAIDCYIMAKGKWMVQEDVPFENYLNTLINDWKAACTNKTYAKDFPSFIQDVTKHLELDNFNATRLLTPVAHTKEPVAPIDVVKAFAELAKSNAKLAIATEQLKPVIQENKVTINGLKRANDSLEGVTNSLAALMSNGGADKLRSALQNKMQLQTKKQ